MKTYTLTYGRTVILKKEIEAETEDKAMEIAQNLENAGSLGILSVNIVNQTDVMDDSWVEDVMDDNTIWEIESDDESE